MVVARTAFVVAVAVQIAIEVVVVPATPLVAVDVFFDGPLPSHSTCPLFCPRVDHMHDNPYLHAQ